MRFASRRAGGSLSSDAETPRQPQDGSPQPVSRVRAIASHLHSGIFNEPEDARLTGGTRSLMRRVLGLNVTAKPKKGADA